MAISSTVWNSIVGLATLAPAHNRMKPLQMATGIAQDQALNDEAERRELRRVLVAMAREQTTVTYRDLCELADIPGPCRIQRITDLLEQIVQEDLAADVPLLAAVAISRSPTGIPQRGFFQLLQKLGRYDGPDDGPDAAAFHRDELELAWAYWGSAS